jgi:PAS domain S-box-containing protein
MRAVARQAALADLARLGLSVPYEELMDCAVAAMELAADLLGVVDLAGGQLVRVNPAWQRLLGWTPDELYAQPFSEFLSGEDRADGEARYVALGAPGAELPEFESSLRTKAGGHRHLLWSARTSDDGRWIYFAAKDIAEQRDRESALAQSAAEHELVLPSAGDPTARRQLETEARLRQAAEQANRAKSEFLSRMSHELRTPLNAVLGFGQLLERAPLEPQHLRYVEHILKGGRHLLTLINEVLDIARIESGDLGLSVEPVALMAAVYGALDMIVPLAEQHGIAVDVDLGEHTGEYVLADLQRLKQIMLNLLSNAVKYNVEGGRVRITARTHGEQVVVAVADTGRGISAADLPKLFSPFERLGAEGSDVEGTGLGLALSRHLAEAMHGSLDVVGQPRQGTTFELRLTRAQLPQSAQNRPSGKAEGPLAACTVLHVEDNIANVRLVEEVFAGGVVEVVAAGTGQLGIDIAATMRPDVVLLDLHLPDMPGWDVLRALRDRPQTAQTPVIVLTADTTRAHERRMHDLGVAQHLTKPLDIDALRSAIAAACGPEGSAHGRR